MLTLFAILQKYEFSSKSQLDMIIDRMMTSCLRYCKSTSFQANHNLKSLVESLSKLFAILQKYEFSSKSQLMFFGFNMIKCCLRYCKSTSFQANHNMSEYMPLYLQLFAILQKYEFSSKSQRTIARMRAPLGCLRYCKSTSFQANHN